MPVSQYTRAWVILEPLFFDLGSDALLLIVLLNGPAARAGLLN